MLRSLSPIVLVAAFAGAPVLVGCDHKSEEKTTIRKSDGTVQEQKKEVTRDANGNVKEEKTVERSNKP